MILISYTCLTPALSLTHTRTHTRHMQELAAAEAALESVLEGIKGEVEGYHKQLSQVCVCACVVCVLTSLALNHCGSVG